MSFPNSFSSTQTHPLLSAMPKQECCVVGMGFSDHTDGMMGSTAHPCHSSALSSAICLLLLFFPHGNQHQFGMVRGRFHTPSADHQSLCSDIAYGACCYLVLTSAHQTGTKTELTPTPSPNIPQPPTPGVSSVSDTYLASPSLKEKVCSNHLWCVWPLTTGSTHDLSQKGQKQLWAFPITSLPLCSARHWKSAGWEGKVRVWRGLVCLSCFRQLSSHFIAVNSL